MANRNNKKATAMERLACMINPDGTYKLAMTKMTNRHDRYDLNQFAQ
jgi:hypothetical protein